MPSKIEISHKTILFTLLLLIILWFIIQIKEVIFWVFIALILMSALKPLVDTLERKRLPRVVAVLVIYALIISLFVFTGANIVPPLVVQSIHLGESLPGYINEVLPFVKIDTQLITQQVAPIGENLLKVTFGLFSNIFGLFTVFVICFYLLLERKHLESQMSQFIGESGSKALLVVITKIEERLGAWVRGQMLLALIIGLATFLGLTILGIPYNLPLSILAGILEIVPFIGPIISAIPAILIALIYSPVMALITTALYILIQQIEAHIVIPMVMRRTVGLPPLVTILALMVGAKLAGIVGALLAIPIVVAFGTIVSEVFKLKTSK